MAKEITYTVRGHWPFPLDMLRRDGSQAATETDQALIDKMASEFTEDQTWFTDVDIVLTGVSRPNTDRWESFGWSVPSETDHAFWKAARAREQHRKQLVTAARAKLTAEEREALKGEDR